MGQLAAIRTTTTEAGRRRRETQTRRRAARPLPPGGCLMPRLINRTLRDRAGQRWLALRWCPVPPPPVPIRNTGSQGAYKKIDLVTGMDVAQSMIRSFIVVPNSSQ